MRKANSIVILLLLAVALPAMSLAQAPQAEPVPFAVVDGQPGTASGVEDVLFEQVYDGYGWYASQCFPDLQWCYYVGDDFVNNDVWSIDTIFVDGSGAIENADSLNWVVYADAGGIPAGYPGDGGELWSLSLAPTGPGVTISDGGDVTVDLIVATGGPVEIPAGHWWLIFFPDMPLSPHGQWGWYTGQPQQYYPAVQHIVAPPWQPQSVHMAFRLEGTIGGAQDPMYAKLALDTREPMGPWGYRVAALAVVKDALQGGMPVEGAEVTFFLKLPDETEWYETVVTDFRGRAKVVMQHPTGGPWRACIEDITHTDYAWDPGPFARCRTIWFGDDPPPPPPGE